MHDVTLLGQREGLGPFLIPFPLLLGGVRHGCFGCEFWGIWNAVCMFGDFRGESVRENHFAEKVSQKSVIG